MTLRSLFGITYVCALICGVLAFCGFDVHESWAGFVAILTWGKPPSPLTGSSFIGLFVGAMASIPIILVASFLTLAPALWLFGVFDKENK